MQANAFVSLRHIKRAIPIVDQNSAPGCTSKDAVNTSPVGSSQLHAGKAFASAMDGVNVDFDRESLFLRKNFPGILLEKSAKITRLLMPSAAPIRPASVPLRHILVYSMRLRSTPANGFTPCRDALYFASACAIRADSGKTPGATAIGD